jgi:ADP-dependent NAD(P)H-hydrate dehydratase / NAD(P)H-hydrate epimerase
VRALYDAETIRAAERPLLVSLPDGTLMQRAATALARRCASVVGRTYGARVVLLVGAGDNGGDALWAGALLAARGARVDALLAADRAHPGGLARLLAAGGRSRPAGGDADADLIGAADLVVDGLLGIGGRGGLRDGSVRLAELTSDSDAIVVAVDLPSGVDASTGEADGPAVRADLTVTFGALKVGLVVEPGASHAGTVELVDIGLRLPSSPVAALDADDVAGMLAAPDRETDKYRRGVVGVVAGSDRYTGAAALAVGGALASGAGMVRYAGVCRPADVVRQRWPEAVVTVVEAAAASEVVSAGRVQSWVVGSGLGTDETAASMLAAVLAADVPVVVDADAVTLLREHRSWLDDRSAPTLLTPHAGEFAHLTGADRADVEARRLERARAAAVDLGVTVLLKGASTIVADPSGAVRVNTAQTPYLATAGSGDVLSGICGTLLAGGCSALDAGAAGAFLHGLAGLLTAGSPPVPFTALDLVGGVPAALAAIRRTGSVTR